MNVISSSFDLLTMADLYQTLLWVNPKWPPFPVNRWRH